MRGSRIPSANRIINSVPPLDPSDESEANALNLMFLWDNMGTGEYMEDGSILARHIDNLFAHEQASPNLTLAIDAGSATFATTFVAFAGGNTPTITAPVSNPRIDMICLKSDGTITRTAGAENVSPVAPAVPVNSIPICTVYCVVGMTVVHDNDTQVAGQGYILTDLRPFVGIGGGVIKSIQTGSQSVGNIGNNVPYVWDAVLTNATTVTVSVTYATGASAGTRVTATSTITSVDTTKAFVVTNGVDIPTYSGAGVIPSVSFSVVEYL